MTKWRQINLRKISDARGNLTPIEGGRDVPFEIARVYYIYDLPGASSRAGHAHRELQQLYIALSGSFEVLLDDGEQQERVLLNLPWMVLYIMPGVWREIVNFSSGATCLALASAYFEESDYIRDHDAFMHVYGPAK